MFCLNARVISAVLVVINKDHKGVSMRESVMVGFEDGEFANAVTYYTDEYMFTPEHFVGMTRRDVEAIPGNSTWPHVSSGWRDCYCEKCRPKPEPVKEVKAADTDWTLIDIDDMEF